MPPRIPRIPPDLQAALNPFMAALGQAVTDVIKRSAEAAADTVLEEIESRAEDVVTRVSKARRKVRAAPASTSRVKDDPGITVEGEPRKRRRRRRD